MVAALPSGEQWTIKAGDQEAVVVEVGGGLRTYRVAGADVADGYAESELCPACCGQVLAPWPNRIRDGKYSFAGESHQLWLTEPTRHNAIHGLVNWARWRLVDSTDDSATLELEMPAQPGYPWTLLLRTTWTLDATGLRAEHTATNLDATPAPFGFSVHPYVMVGSDGIENLLLQVPARSRLLSDGRQLPIGAARVAGSDFDFTQPKRIGSAVIDISFGDIVREPDGSSSVSLSTVDGTGSRIWADAAFGWWQVFTGDTLGAVRARRSVAIEPMTCPPDAFRSGRDLIVLEPGQTWRGSWGISALS